MGGGLRTFLVLHECSFLGSLFLPDLGPDANTRCVVVVSLFCFALEIFHSLPSFSPRGSHGFGFS